MPKIRRAVKCAAVGEQLKETLEIAKRTQIHGLEVHEVLPLMEESSFKERIKIILEVFNKYPLASLAYHFPLPPSPALDDSQNCFKFDLASKEGEYIFDFTKDTVKEAASLGQALKIETEIPVVVHLFGFANPEKITAEERNEKLELGEKRLKELKEVADYYSRQSGVKVVITRENNPPEHGDIAGLLDFHPKDVSRTIDSGIGANLDLAHIWMNILYWKEGKRELAGPDLNKKIYPQIDLEETIDLLKPGLRLLHLNDAGPGYRKEFEGLEIGKGTLPHSFIIPLICSKLNTDVIGTYEIKYGHKEPQSVLRSDQFYRNLFGAKFEDYFE